MKPNPPINILSPEAFRRLSKEPEKINTLYRDKLSASASRPRSGSR